MEPESDFDEFKWLKEYAPCFEIDAKNIEVIHEPKDFYANLKVCLFLKIPLLVLTY